MKTYQEIRARIALLEKQADAIRKREQKSVIAKMKETIDQYGLSAADLGFGRTGGSARGGSARKSAASKSVGVPKYQDPQTQKTWTGRGKPPNWIAGVKDRDAYLIDPPAAGERAAGPKASAKSAAAKRKPKPGRRNMKRIDSPAVQIESGAASQ